MLRSRSRTRRTRRRWMRQGERFDVDGILSYNRHRKGAIV
nr:MAG TPA: hypothetical protein [Caudoviricetes sp.]